MVTRLYRQYIYIRGSDTRTIVHQYPIVEFAGSVGGT